MVDNKKCTKEAMKKLNKELKGVLLAGVFDTSEVEWGIHFKSEVMANDIKSKTSTVTGIKYQCAWINLEADVYDDDIKFSKQDNLESTKVWVIKNPKYINLFRKAKQLTSISRVVPQVGPQVDNQNDGDNDEDEDISNEEHGNNERQDE